MTFSFEKLEVWQLSRTLTKSIYLLTETFPSSEQFGLTNQMRRCSVSVSSNIAEAAGRLGKQEKVRFYSIAFGSLLELLNQLILSNDLGYMGDEVLKETRGTIESISRMLNALKKNLKM